MANQFTVSRDPQNVRNLQLVSVISEAAMTFGADLIVVGLDRRRLAHNGLSRNVREQLTAATDVPVLMAPKRVAVRVPAIRRGGRSPSARTRCTGDGGRWHGSCLTTSWSAPQISGRGPCRAPGSQLAVASGGTVHIVTAFRWKPGEAALGAASRTWFPESPVRIQTHSVRSRLTVEAITSARQKKGRI